MSLEIFTSQVFKTYWNETELSSISSWTRLMKLKVEFSVCLMLMFNVSNIWTKAKHLNSILTCQRSSCHDAALHAKILFSLETLYKHCHSLHTKNRFREAVKKNKKYFWFSLVTCWLSQLTHSWCCCSTMSEIYLLLLDNTDTVQIS